MRTRAPPTRHVAGDGSWVAETPFTIEVCGPRDDPRKHTLTLTCGMGALADRNGGA